MAKLSKGILEMKFMKRTRDKVIKEEDDAEGRAMYSSEITEKMIQGKSQFIIEPSYVPCENLIDGRLSFRGMNPEIERILELEALAKLTAATDTKDNVKKDVTDKEMASTYYSNLSKTMDRKFKPKEKRRMVLPEPIGQAAQGPADDFQHHEGNEQNKTKKWKKLKKDNK